MQNELATDYVESVHGAVEHFVQRTWHVARLKGSVYAN